MCLSLDLLQFGLLHLESLSGCQVLLLMLDKHINAALVLALKLLDLLGKPALLSLEPTIISHSLIAFLSESPLKLGNPLLVVLQLTLLSINLFHLLTDDLFSTLKIYLELVRCCYLLA